jgi:hypothetical protein
MAKHFNFTDRDFALIALGEQTFVKKSYPTYENHAKYSYPYPFSCTTFPWDNDNQVLLTDATPGSAEALCTINPYYCESQDTLKDFYAQYLAAFQTTFLPQYELEKSILAMDLDTQCEVAQMLVSRAGYDGEMAGSGAAMDPLFWVAHGSVERLMQKIIFSGVSNGTSYDSTSVCSGHQNDGTKAWLKGYYFEDTSIAAETVTNVQLNEYLNPTSDYYRDYFNFVYDSSSKLNALKLFTKGCWHIVLTECAPLQVTTSAVILLPGFLVK